MNQFFVFVIIIVVCSVGYYAYNYYDNLLFKKLDRRKNVKFSPEIIAKLETLNEKLVNEGCNGFYIHKVNESNFAEGYWLEFRNNKWIVYFSERGQESTPIFNNIDSEKAFKFFYDLIIREDHWHLVIITFSIETFKSYKDNLEKYGIVGVQNDIDNYRGSGEHAYRLFVKNKEIFKVKELLEEVPFFDYKNH